MRKKIKKWIPFILIMLCLTSALQVCAADFSDGEKYLLSQSKPASCKVSFQNNVGKTSHDYRVLNKTVSRGDSIRLPQLPSRKGKQGLGWTTVPKGKKVRYKPGEVVQVTKNMKFYAVFRKKSSACTVNYYDSSGIQGTAFSSLKQIVAPGKKVIMPELPLKSGCVGIGWCPRKNSVVPVYHPGERITVSESLSLYAVYKKTVTVSLFNNDGSLYKNIEVGKGESFTFPAVLNKNNCTMLGWASVPGRQTNPEFEAGESIRVNYNRNFYAVMFNRDSEADYPLSDLPALDTARYQEVIFVGDSRMERLSYVLTKDGPQPFLQDVTFVAKGGKGLSWLQTSGYSWLLQEIGSGAGTGKPIAVIFNMGINDLGNIENYISFYKQIAGELTSKGCKLFFASLTPINTENLKEVGIQEKKERKEEWVRSFNTSIRSRLCTGANSVGTYMDVGTYLIRNGYGMDSGRNGVESGIDDGLHYTNKTYKRIYKYCVDYLNGKI